MNATSADQLDRQAPPAPLRLDRAMIEAAIRGNCFIGQYGDVPAVNGVTVAADAIWALHCADLALVQAKEASA
jgi:hypothetical protein